MAMLDVPYRPLADPKLRGNSCLGTTLMQQASDASHRALCQLGVAMTFANGFQQYGYRMLAVARPGCPFKVAYLVVGLVPVLVVAFLVSNWRPLECRQDKAMYVVCGNDAITRKPNASIALVLPPATKEFSWVATCSFSRATNQACRRCFIEPFVVRDGLPLLAQYAILECSHQRASHTGPLWAGRQEASLPGGLFILQTTKHMYKHCLERLVAKCKMLA